MQRRKKISEAAMYAVIAIIGCLLYFYLIPTQIPQRSSWSGDVVFSSRTFPNIIAIVMMVTAAIGAVKEILAAVKTRPEEGEADSGNTTAREARQALLVALFYGIILAYAVLFSHAGYLVATAIMIPAVLWLMGSRKPWQYIAVYGFAAIIYAVFRFLLKVPLP